MDLTHLHLTLTHFPIVGTVIGLLVLIAGLVLKNQIVTKVALAVFVFSSITTIPVFLTGESAEETVEHMAGINENDIEEHEEAAEQVIWVMAGLGVLSLFCFILIMLHASFARIMTIITLVFALITGLLFARVGNLGGQIRHSEIRANSNQTQTLEITESQSEHHEEDDD